MHAAARCFFLPAGPSIAILMSFFAVLCSNFCGCAVLELFTLVPNPPFAGTSLLVVHSSNFLSSPLCLPLRSVCSHFALKLVSVRRAGGCFQLSEDGCHLYYLTYWSMEFRLFTRLLTQRKVLSSTDYFAFPTVGTAGPELNCFSGQCAIGLGCFPSIFAFVIEGRL